MSNIPVPPAFRPKPPDVASVLSWFHLGDLQMTRSGQQNNLDLCIIVDNLNFVFSEAISFVFLQGDVSENGRAW